jgi:hypothetical protein
MSRPTVSRPIYPGVKPHLGPKTRFLLVTAFLTSGRVCLRVPRDSWLYCTVLDSRLPQPGVPGLRIYIPYKQGGPVIPPVPPGIGFPFRRLLRFARLRRYYSNPRPPPPRRARGMKSKTKPRCDQRSVGQSVLVSSPIWDPSPNFLIAKSKLVYDWLFTTS